MGFDANSTRLIFLCREEKINFGKTLTLGRQELHLSEKELQSLLNRYFNSAISAKEILTMRNGYCEPLLNILGAESVDSMDTSNYENATILHDLNLRISEDLKEQFSTVIDSGTLEHVFNFPTAIKNCMEMIKLSGYYIGITPANNFFGHGFYQFSPELLFRIFSDQYGFHVKKMILFTDKPKSRFYEVVDPLKINSRVIMANYLPSYLFVLAQRVSIKEPFGEQPQQSDYQHDKWLNHTNKSSVGKESRLKYLKILLPNLLKHKIKLVIQKSNLFRKMIFTDIGNANPDYFKRIKI
jgi:hypothetical protein